MTPAATAYDNTRHIQLISPLLMAGLYNKIILPFDGIFAQYVITKRIGVALPQRARYTIPWRPVRTRRSGYGDCYW